MTALRTITYARRSYSIDWSQNTAALAQSTGLDKGTISRLRRLHAPESMAVAQTADPAMPVAGHPDLASFLRACMERAGGRRGGYTACAEAVGVTPRSLRRWLTGEDRPALAALARLVQWWELTPGETAHRAAPERQRRGLTVSGRQVGRNSRCSVRLSTDHMLRLNAAARRANVEPERYLAQILERALA
jgi:transcriptional regulator with XRE-family HTH domain